MKWALTRFTGKPIVRIDPRYFRPAEVDILIGDPGKAKQKLGWEPTVKFEELVTIMMDADLKALDLSFFYFTGTYSDIIKKK